MVWIDLNNDGNKVNGEPAAPNVKVELLNVLGTVISTTWTDSAGLYTFTNLLSGTYQVQVTTNLKTWSNLGLPRFAAGATDSMYVGGGASGYYRVTLLRQ